mgnify:CR=1 FL=1
MSQTARQMSIGMNILGFGAHASAWRKAAVWHSRDTHDALVNHWQAHGPDPVIERALRAGCLVMNAAAGPVH